MIQFSTRNSPEVRELRRHINARGLFLDSRLAPGQSFSGFELGIQNGRLWQRAPHMKTKGDGWHLPPSRHCGGEREGLLKPGQYFDGQGKQKGEVVAAINVRLDPSRVFLIYRHTIGSIRRAHV